MTMDFLIVTLWPVLMFGAIAVAELLAGTGGSVWAWRGRLLCGLLALHGAYLARFPYGLTPRRLSMKIGGLRRGRQVVRLVGTTGALLATATMVLVFV